MRVQSVRAVCVYVYVSYTSESCALNKHRVVR